MPALGKDATLQGHIDSHFHVDPVPARTRSEQPGQLHGLDVSGEESKTLSLTPSIHLHNYT